MEPSYYHRYRLIFLLLASLFCVTSLGDSIRQSKVIYFPIIAISDNICHGTISSISWMILWHFFPALRRFKFHHQISISPFLQHFLLSFLFGSIMDIDHFILPSYTSPFPSDIFHRPFFHNSSLIIIIMVLVLRKKLKDLKDNHREESLSHYETTQQQTSNLTSKSRDHDEASELNVLPVVVQEDELMTNKKKKDQISTLNIGLCMIISSWTSHQLRDGIRRGIWFYPLISTPPIPYPLYLVSLIVILPFLMVHFIRWILFIK